MSLIRKLIKEFSAVREIGGWRCLGEFSIHSLANFRHILRDKTLSRVDLAMSRAPRRYYVCGETISLQGVSFGGARELYGRQVYFALPEFRLRPTDVVVDLGANIGVFTTLAGRLASKVVAVEAQSEFLQLIRSHADINHCGEKVSVEFGLIGPDSGWFSDLRQLESASHYRESPPVLSMNELLARYAIHTINFLKIDIEGSEFSLFSNHLEWLSKVKKIAMEVHPQFGSVATLVSILEKHYFHVRLLDHEQRPVNCIADAPGYLFALRRGS